MKSLIILKYLTCTHVIGIKDRIILTQQIIIWERKPHESAIYLSRFALYRIFSIIKSMKRNQQSDLNLADLPDRDSDWPEIVRFAARFNGYEFWGDIETSHQQANRIRQSFESRRVLPEDLNTLRACLFYEARRWRHSGYDPDERGLQYIRALVSAIADLVKKEGNQ